MSKSRLRALNTQNTAVNPPHTDMNYASLMKSWKLWYKFLTTSTLIKNQKLIMVALQTNLVDDVITSIRRFKRRLYITRFSSKRSTILHLNKNNITNIKIVVVQNRIFIINLVCPTQQVTSIVKPKTTVVKRNYEHDSRNYM